MSKRKPKLAVGAIVLLGFIGWTALYVQQTRVSVEAIEVSVTRTRELLDRAWELPVAATFKGNIVWQSNASVCGAASLASAFRSLGEAPNSE
jgi:hypothetical protein